MGQQQEPNSAAGGRSLSTNVLEPVAWLVRDETGCTAIWERRPTARDMANWPACMINIEPLYLGDAIASKILSVRNARDELGAALKATCTCSGFVLQYEGHCCCGRGDSVMAAEQKLAQAIAAL